jgi:hypothetical protein
MANLLFVEDVAAYMRLLIDEPDDTFVTSAILQSWLRIGYNRYYQFVTDQNPERFVLTQALPLAGVSEYDLNGILLGAAAPRRLLQIHRVVKVDTNGLITQMFKGKNSIEELVTPTYGTVAYVLQGTKLYFSAVLNDTYRIDYIPMTLIDWSKLTAGSEWIDDLVQFHDLIALYAAQQYFAADNQPNPMIESLLITRQKDFNNHLTRGRDLNANRFVQEEDPWY